MKRLILLCLCLALFTWGAALPSVVFGYAEPDANGVRLDPYMPGPFAPPAVALNPTHFYNVHIEQEDAIYGLYMGCKSAFTTVYNGLLWWIPLYEDHNGCHYLVYHFEYVEGGYDPTQYDYDGDGDPDVIDQKPDTPLAKLTKGIPPNTAMKDESNSTQGCSKANKQPTGMPGLLINLAHLNFVLTDKDIAYQDRGRTIQIVRTYNALQHLRGDLRPGVDL